MQQLYLLSPDAVWLCQLGNVPWFSPVLWVINQNGAWDLYNVCHYKDWTKLALLKPAGLHKVEHFCVTFPSGVCETCMDSEALTWLCITKTMSVDFRWGELNRILEHWTAQKFRKDNSKRRALIPADCGIGIFLTCHVFLLLSPCKRSQFCS